MSLLELRPSRHGVSTGVCMEPKCPNKGRNSVFIIGYPILGRWGQRELLCEKHAGEWRRVFDELGRAEHPEMRAAA